MVNTDNSQPLVSTAALMSTSITAQTLGGALAVIYLAYHHIPEPANGISAQMLEDAFTLVFSTAISLSAMIGHVLIALLTRTYLTSKT